MLRKDFGVATCTEVQHVYKQKGISYVTNNYM